MRGSDQACDHCGVEVFDLDSLVTLAEVLRAHLCTRCANAWSETVLFSAEGGEHALAVVAYETTIRSGNIIAAEDAARQYWLAKRVMFDFAKRWITEGQGPADADAAAGTR